MRQLIRVFLLLVLTAGVMSAQGRGKISGKVIDAETKEPLFGVNIVIQGTAMGAASDFDGQFVILNVLPGKYNIVATMIGYGRMEIQNVQVNIDLTTTLSFALSTSAIAMKDVIIEAKLPPVVKDRTESYTSMSSDEIMRAPVEGLRQVMELSANVQRTSNGNLTIRGSGAYEVNVMVDGVSQSSSSTGVPGFGGGLGDKVNNSWRYDFNPFGVAQMQLISGGFSAEYGNAQAGVVKIVTKEGSDRLKGDFRFEYRAPGQYHWGDYLYSANSPEWKEWGSLAQWTLNTGMDSARIVQNYGVSGDSVNIWRQLMYDFWLKNHTPGDQNQLGAYDYRELAYQRFLFGFGGPLGSDPNALRFYFSGETRSVPTRLPTAERTQEYQNYTLTLTYQPVQMQKLKLSAMYQHYRGGVNTGSEDVRYAGRDASYKYYLVTDPIRNEYITSQSLIWTNTLSQNSFAEIQLTHQYENNIIVLEPVPQRASTWRDNVFKGSWYIAQGPWDAGYRTIFSFTTFNQQDLRTHMYNLMAHFTSQVSQAYQVKVGVQAQYWDMNNSAVYSSFAANAFITRTGFAEYYKTYPYYIAAYAQNKLEYEGMVANIGIRMDLYNMNSDVPVNRFAPIYYAEGGNGVGDPRTRKPETQITYSPRLGISFPVGENTAFRLQYGHFNSMPVFTQAYTRTNYNGWGAYGNADLKPKRTINYEIGIQQSIGGGHRLDFVAYYNDRVSQIGGLQIAKGLTVSTTNNYYSTYANNGFGATRGFDVTLERLDTRVWGYRLSYSFSRTSYGNYGVSRIYSEDPNDPRNINTYSPLDYLDGFDRTHTFRTLVSYKTEHDGGMEIFGIRPFADIAGNVSYTAQTGTPFSYVPSYDVSFKDYVNGNVVNNRRYPLEAKIDLSFTKGFLVGRTAWTLGLRVSNLFDNRWMTPALNNDMLTDWVERNVTIDDPAGAPTRDNYKFRYFQAYRNMPREIYFTIGFGF